MRFCSLFTLFALSSITSISQVNLQNGLQACYSFSGNANDGTANGYHGTVHGAVLTPDRFGNPNKAYKFDGIDDYIQVPNNAFVPNAQYTFSMWLMIQVNVPYGQASGILSIGFSDGRHQNISLTNFYSSAQHYGWTAGGLNSDNTGTAVQTGIAPVLNTWYHVVTVRTGTTLSLYVNGTFIMSSPTLGASPVYYNSPGAVAMIGIRCNLIQAFRGSVDDIAIYNRPLSQAEVAKLYQDGLPCSGVPPVSAGNVTRCGAGAVTLTATGGTGYRWYDAEQNGTLLFEGNPFPVSALSQTKDFYVANLVSNQESARTKVTATVFPQPALTCQVPDVVAPGLPQTFGASVTGGTAPFNYQFTFGDGTVTTTPTQSQSHTYTTQGDYVLQVTSTDNNGCVASCSKNVVVLPPSANAADVTRCGPGTVTFTATGGTGYRWYDAEQNGNLLFEGNPFHTPALLQTGNFYVANVVNNAESKRTKVTATVFPQPELACQAPNIIFGGLLQTFGVTATGGAVPFNYQFDFGDGTVTTTPTQSQSHTYTTQGDYTIQVTGTDNNGCVALCSKDVVVLHTEIFIPNVITTNEDGFNEIFTAYLDVGNNYHVYNGEDFFEMHIYNRWGREVFASRKASDGWSSNDSSPGIYFYLIVLGDNAYRGALTVMK